VKPQVQRRADPGEIVRLADILAMDSLRGLTAEGTSSLISAGAHVEVEGGLVCVDSHHVQSGIG
jgi:hypothetical protein